MAIAADIGVVIHPAQPAARVAVLEGLRRQPAVASVVVEIPRAVHQLPEEGGKREGGVSACSSPPCSPPAAPTPASRPAAARHRHFAPARPHGAARSNRVDRGWLAMLQGYLELMQGWLEELEWEEGRRKDALRGKRAAANGASARKCSDLASVVGTCCSLRRIIIPVLMACADSSAATVLKVQQLKVGQTQIENR